jgi:2,3-bisphosphoglycerate-dependent phosphoglycerate mutase
MGELIRGLPVDQAIASAQIRSLETLLCMEDAAGIDVPITRDPAVNERDYGDYTGKNKWELKKEIGEEKFDQIRRDWDCPVPNGETLKMVYGRVWPYYMKVMLPILKSGKSILLVAHGNSIRALMKYLEDIPDEGMSKIEMPFGAVYIYEVDATGRMTKKESRIIPSSVPA